MCLLVWKGFWRHAIQSEVGWRFISDWKIYCHSDIVNFIQYDTYQADMCINFRLLHWATGYIFKTVLFLYLQFHFYSLLKPTLAVLFPPRQRSPMTLKLTLAHARLSLHIETQCTCVQCCKLNQHFALHAHLQRYA